MKHNVEKIKKEFLENIDIVSCLRCNGTGNIKTYDYYTIPMKVKQSKKPCKDCNGKGYVIIIPLDTPIQLGSLCSS